MRGRDDLLSYRQRRNRILSLLSISDSLGVGELAELMGCSLATARRDVAQLESEGMVERYWGGLRRRLTADASERGQDLQNLRPNVSHMAIGKYAAGRVRQGDLIFIGSGTTTLAMVPFLEHLDIRVVTNGIPQVEALSRLGIDAFLLGGSYKGFSRSIVGREAVEMLKGMKFSRAFFGVNGIGVSYSILSADKWEDEIKRQAIIRSRYAYALVGAEKFGMAGRYSIDAADAFGTELVTDRRPDASTAWINDGRIWHAPLLSLVVNE